MRDNPYPTSVRFNSQMSATNKQMPPNSKDELSIALKEAEAAFQPSQALQTALKDLGTQYQAQLGARIQTLTNSQAELQGDLNTLNKRTREVLPGMKLSDKSNVPGLEHLLSQTIESFNGLQRDFESLESSIDALDSKALKMLAPSRPPQIGLSEPSISMVSIDPKRSVNSSDNKDSLGSIGSGCMCGTSSLKILLNKDDDAYKE